MNYKVENDTSPLNVLYDKAFTAVNAPNVMHQKVVYMMEPFQPMSRFPEGVPPVRYPDVTTIGGFLEDPREDEADARNAAAAMADGTPELFPAQHDDQAVGRAAYQKPTFGNLARDEQLARMLFPGSDKKVQSGWDDF